MKFYIIFLIFFVTNYIFLYIIAKKQQMLLEQVPLFFGIWILGVHVSDHWVSADTETPATAHL